MHQVLDCLYRDLLSEIQVHGENQLNQRTGHMVRSVPSLQLRVDMGIAGSDLLQIPAWRKMYPKSALAEMLWTIQGTRSPEWINEHTQMWKLWTEEDGTIPTAYGYRWRHAFGRDQLVTAMQALEKDSSSRQVNVFAWHPGVDGNGEPNQPKNIPCILGFTVNVINGALNMSVYLRSSDTIVGLPYDYMAFGFLMHFMCNTLKVRPGVLCLHLAHAHYYHVHTEIVHRILDTDMTTNWLTGKALSVDLETAVNEPDMVMDWDLKQANNSDYNPRPELVL